MVLEISLFTCRGVHYNDIQDLSLTLQDQFEYVPYGGWVISIYKACTLKHS